MTPLPDTHPHDRNAMDDRSEANTSAAGAPKTSFTILLLEDDPSQADPLCDMLQFAGYSCVIAYSKTRASAELAKPDQLFALMIADLNLARDDDAAFVRETRGAPRYSALPVIITTGHDSREAREQGRLMGRIEHLVKPFDTDALLQLIARWTRAKS